MAKPESLKPDTHPALLLGASLGLIALFVLPGIDGGYSGAGYQVGFVLLPLAAALCWAAGARRPLAAVLVLLLFMLSSLGLPVWIQPGRELWFNMLHAAAAWMVAWVMLTAVPQRARLLLPALVCGALLPALWGWFLWLGSGELGYQISGSFGLHNAFAGYLLLAWPAAAYAAQCEANPRYRWLYIAAALLLALTLVLTYSRAAWLCFALQLLTLGLCLLWRRFVARRALERTLLAGGAGLVVLLLLLLTLPPVREVLARLLDWNGYSMQGRLRFWQAALAIFRDHPLGIGLGNFAYVYPQYQLDWKYYSVDPHSWVLQLLCELGVAGGLIASAVLVGFVLWKWRVWRASGGAPGAALLIVAVGGSLAHAAVDFDYTFGATTSLLGALLALGAFEAWRSTAPRAADDTGAAARQAGPPTVQPAPVQPPWIKAAVVLTVALLVACAAVGEAFTAERYVLDRLRDAPGLPVAAKQALLAQAVRYNPYDFKPRYQLASLQARGGATGGREQALNNLDACLKLNRRYARGWALKALLARPLSAGDADMEHALDLDKYNFPEHYYYWANLTQDNAERKRRLLLGMERIPVDDPITPEHIRPTWYELNPLFAEWWFELSRLSTDQQEKDLFIGRGARFKAYWDEVLKERGQSAQPPAAGEAST